MRRELSKGGDRALAKRFGLGMFEREQIGDCLKRCRSALRRFPLAVEAKSYIFKINFLRRKVDDEILELCRFYHVRKNYEQYPSNEKSRDILNEISDKFSKFTSYINSASQQHIYIINLLARNFAAPCGADPAFNYEAMLRAFNGSPLVRLQNDAILRERITKLPIFTELADESDTLSMYLCDALEHIILRNGGPKIPSNFKVDLDNRWGNGVESFENEAVHLLYLLVAAIDPSISAGGVRSTLEVRRQRRARSRQSP